MELIKNNWKIEGIYDGTTNQKKWNRGYNSFMSLSAGQTVEVTENVDEGKVIFKDLQDPNASEVTVKPTEWMADEETMTIIAYGTVFKLEKY